jgi:hypothetical protein
LASPEQSIFRREIYLRDNIRHLKLDWHLEAFPECLGKGISPAPLMEMIASVYLTAAELRGEWYKMTGTDKTHSPSPFQSFVQYQLRRLPYLPVKANIWGKRQTEGREAFWPQTGIRGVTPDLDLIGFKDPRRAALRPTLAHALGFQTRLPDRWDEWLRWNDALVAAAERGEIPGGLRSTREFYEQMLDPSHGGKESAKPAKIVCVDPTAPGGLKPVPRAAAAWIDRPALATPEVLAALSAAGLPYLPALLATASGATDQLGVSPASQKIEVAPGYEEEPNAQTALQRRLDARWRAIAVQCEAKRAKLPPKPRLRAVHGLTLTISLKGKAVAEVASSAFKDGDEWLIDIGRRWDAVASALCDGIGYASDLRYRFAAVLHAPNADAVTRLLLDDGIPSYKLATLKLDDTEDEQEGEDGVVGAEPDESLAATASGENGGGNSDATPSPPPPRPPPEQPSRPAGSHFSSGTLAHRPLYDSPNNRDGSRSGGGGGGGWGPQHAAGIAGEEWLRQLVASRLPEGWAVALNERDEAAGESDIIVRSPTGEWHVEVKTLSSERLYWSDLEREKAERQPQRYWMCFLVRQGYSWRIHWSWDPLVDLLPCERRVQWQWASESEGPKLAKHSWEPIGGTGPPMIPPDRATTVIRILDDQVRALAEDDTSLSLFWKRVLSQLEQGAS